MNQKKTYEVCANVESHTKYNSACSNDTFNLFFLFSCPLQNVHVSVYKASAALLEKTYMCDNQIRSSFLFFYFLYFCGYGLLYTFLSYGVAVMKSRQLEGACLEGDSCDISEIK